VPEGFAAAGVEAKRAPGDRLGIGGGRGRCWTIRARARAASRVGPRSLGAWSSGARWGGGAGSSPRSGPMPRIGASLRRRSSARRPLELSVLWRTRTANWSARTQARTSAAVAATTGSRPRASSMQLSSAARSPLTLGMATSARPVSGVARVRWRTRGGWACLRVCPCNFGLLRWGASGLRAVGIAGTGWHHHKQSATRAESVTGNSHRSAARNQCGDTEVPRAGSGRTAPARGTIGGLG